MERKGIILAGGKGTRLFPLTQIISKQLLPIYNKPMIYYSMSILMLAGIKEILIISDKKNLPLFKKFLGSGAKWGIELHYKVQNQPKGIAEAFLIGKKFINNHPVALILGDNIFFGHGFSNILQKISKRENSTVFLYQAKDPERFGVASLNANKEITKIIEKPKKPQSNLAVTGLYFYDKNVVELTKELKFSHRNELEITDLNNLYIKKYSLHAEILSRGFNWYDTGTFDSLLDASNMIKSLEIQQNLKIGYPYEISYKNKWISKYKLLSTSKSLNVNEQNYIKKIIDKN